MKSRLPIIAFYFALILLFILSIAVAYRLVFLPPCVPTKDIPCPVTDAGSIAGAAATVMGVAATVLALLGAFAVAAWWNQLDERIKKQVSKETEIQVADIFDKRITTRYNQMVNALLQDQSAKFNEQMKELQRTLTEADNNLNTNLQNFSQVQTATIKNINDVGEALLYLSVGTRLWEQKKIKSAIAEFRKAKQLQPDDAQVNYILGEIYRKIGSYDEAIDCLKIAIATEKEFALAHFELGMAYRSQADKLYGDPSSKQQHDEEYDKAIEHLSKAKRLLPDDEEIIATLGGTYRRYRKYQDALNYYHQALDLNPDSSYALGNVASISWHEGKLDDSRKAYRRTEELATGRIHSNISYEPFWDYYDRAMAKLVLGPKDEALDDYRSAAKLTFNPENFQSVLDGLIFLKEVENLYPISGLNEALAIVEAGKTEAENRIAKQTTP
jgi:tetratricopeptide (TPR) repeat protein